ncbi:MAG: hypothetical protein LBS03_06520 [Bacteroidales bacterium]|jgi:hypothetical protein|nr:hypothetical protein [Bacteroidales bacterium]
MTLIAAFWFHCSVLFHPVYVSVANMDIDASGEGIALSLKVFADDMETVLHNKYNIDGWIGAPQEHRDSRRLIGEYLSERLVIEANRKERVLMHIDSMSIHEEALWIYMKGKSGETIRHLTIENRVLTDFFRQQTNLVIIGTGKKEEGYSLNRNHYKIEVSL